MRAAFRRRTVVAQIVILEVAVLLAVVAWPGQWWWRGSTLAALVLVAVLVFGRRHGRALWAWAMVALVYRRRAQRGPDQLVNDPAGHPAPTIEAHRDRAGTSFGLVRDHLSWTSVVALGPVDDQGRRLSDSIGLHQVLGALADDDNWASVQVVLRVLPAPSPRVDPRSPVATSYRELAAGSVAQRELLVCIRLEPARCPRAVTVRGGGDVGARRALATSTARLVAALADIARVRVLGADDVRAAVAAGLGVAPGPTTERWDGIDHGLHGVQVCYRLDIPGSDPTQLVADLTSVPGVSIVGSATVGRGAADADVEVVVRVLCLPEDRAAVDTALRRMTHARGARVIRLDGEHAAATRSTLPGGARPRSHRATARRVGSVPGWATSLSLPLDRGGLVLGRGDDGRPAPFELFRSRPTAVSALLDHRVVLVLAFRALALGARVSVVSTRTERWLPLRRLGVDDRDVVELVSPETFRLSSPTPRPDRPHLVVVDLPDASDLPPVPGRPWQCVVAVLPELSMRRLPAARARGPVLLRRLSRREAVAVVPFLGLPAGSDQVLTGLADDQVALVVGAVATVIDLALTVPESQLVVAATSAPAGSAAAAASAADPARPRVQAEHHAQQR
ncbi:MAG: type VII secretion protein EccE [Phycicoccus sp.]